MESFLVMTLAFVSFEYWWVIIPGVILGLYAQFKLMSVYGRFVQVGNESGISGAEAAREILDRAGMSSMPVREVAGQLTDHYNPMEKALYLSSDNYHGRSLAAVGVAAHEAGHALQHQASYSLLKLRMIVAPATHIATKAWMGITLLGMFLGGAFLHKFIGIAIGIFSVITLFHLITLPVEYDASRRAKVQLIRLGLISSREQGAVSQVLSAAALTYVAALVSSLLQLLQLVMIARGRDSNRS